VIADRYAAAKLDFGAYDVRDAELFKKILEADRRASDVRDAIDRADLVKMHPLYVRTVDFGFRLRDRAKYRVRSLFAALA